jgi:hypothetical protein
MRESERERVRAVVRCDVREKQIDCVLPFPFSVFLFKKIKNITGGPARADAQASRAVYSPLGGSED